MKITKIVLSLLSISILSFSFVAGQEKTNEKRVKIVIADKSGAKVGIDTTFSSLESIDSLILRDGSIVYIGSKPGEEKLLSLPGAKHIIIKSSDSDKAEKEVKEITIVSSDSVVWQSAPEKDAGKVFIYSNSGNLKSGSDKSYEIIARLEKEDKGTGRRYIIITDEDDAKKDLRSDLGVIVESVDDSDRDIDKTHYVIAKNGIVITIEGDDEVKVKELANEIEKRLDIKKDKEADKTAADKPGKTSDKNK